MTAAATTVDDLAVLAPRVPATVADAVHDADPDLDADLAAWFAEDCDRPRLVLLGPVRARTRGDALAVAKRKAYYTELLAYLALRPAGATPAQVADAFGITPGRVRTDIKAVRDWLGVNPRTGQRHLPDATKSPAARDRGIGVYQVLDVLVDVDLFRRLRVRAQARGGPAGHADLARALTLVTGPPFDHLRDGGWSWLLEGDRLDHHMTCAIVDVAHLLTTRALTDGDLDQARTAAETAVLAAPHDDTPRLDLAAVHAAAGHHHHAQRIIRDDICNPADDQAPLDLPDRTRTIIADHDWLTGGEEAS